MTRLLHTLREEAPPGRTTRALVAALAETYDRPTVQRALKELQGSGWILKGGRPADRQRADQGHAWTLTAAGRAELDQRVAERASREVAQWLALDGPGAVRRPGPGTPGQGDK
jgi:hypothetical protein